MNKLMNRLMSIAFALALFVASLPAAYADGPVSGGGLQVRQTDLTMTISVDACTRTITYTVKNSGAVKASMFFVQAAFWTDANGSSATLTVPELAAGQSWVHTDTYLMRQTYVKVYGLADSDKHIAETNELNNSASGHYAAQTYCGPTP